MKKTGAVFAIALIVSAAAHAAPSQEADPAQAFLSEHPDDIHQTMSASYTLAIKLNNEPQRSRFAQALNCPALERCSALNSAISPYFSVKVS